MTEIFDVSRPHHIVFVGEDEDQFAFIHTLEILNGLSSPLSRMDGHHIRDLQANLLAYMEREHLDPYNPKDREIAATEFMWRYNQPCPNPEFDIAIQITIREILEITENSFLDQDAIDAEIRSIAASNHWTIEETCESYLGVPLWERD